MSNKRTLRMRFFASAMFVIGSIFAGALPSLAERVDSGVPGLAFDHNVPVTMTDGVQLRANIYRPDKPGRFPVLMLMGPTARTLPMRTRLPTSLRGLS
jgi:hypothetical protein